MLYEWTNRSTEKATVCGIVYIVIYDLKRKKKPEKKRLENTVVTMK